MKKETRHVNVTVSRTMVLLIVRRNMVQPIVSRTMVLPGWAETKMSSSSSSSWL